MDACSSGAKNGNGGSARALTQLSVIHSPGERQEEVEFPPLGPRIKVLMVWPRFPPSFWGLHGVLELVPHKANQPPLGLVTIAALCPQSWEIRLIDRMFEPLEDSDILWADLVMVSGMGVQKHDMLETLARARALGRRTMLGGPHASVDRKALLPFADHVVVGEPDEIFSEIAADLERGSAKRYYEVLEKPDVTNTPIPRFDLLKLDKYFLMPVQFSRGCPFQCEFCDIITIYGRKPRTKPPERLLAELDVLYQLGWRRGVFIVDDNFIGNHMRALELVRQLEQWQTERGYGMSFFTEASIDLAQRTELLEAMVRANFHWVFIGIESPSAESLKETKKYQNLRRDLLESVRYIQGKGLLVSAGFIVGFDSDTEDIFETQKKFVELAAIPWAMTGFLGAPPTTPLYDRMEREGRLIPDVDMLSNFDPPNFRTVLPLPVMLAGLRDILASLYSPEAFYDRAYRALEYWETQPQQRPTPRSWPLIAQVVWRSLLVQGIRSSYRKAYWRFLRRAFVRWRGDLVKLDMTVQLLLSGHHFITYAQTVVAQLEDHLARALAEERRSEMAHAATGT
jgi:radical SAM superfamily enzyme YgiQ (UPF0313 family)